MLPSAEKRSENGRAAAAGFDAGAGLMAAGAISIDTLSTTGAGAKETGSTNSASTSVEASTICASARGVSRPLPLSGARANGSNAGSATTLRNGAGVSSAGNPAEKSASSRKEDSRSSEDEAE